MVTTWPLVESKQEWYSCEVGGRGMLWKAVQERHFFLGLLPSFVNSLAFIPPVLQRLQGLLCLQASLCGAGDRAISTSPEHKLVPGGLGFSSAYDHVGEGWWWCVARGEYQASCYIMFSALFLEKRSLIESEARLAAREPSILPVSASRCCCNRDPQSYSAFTQVLEI